MRRLGDATGRHYVGPTLPRSFLGLVPPSFSRDEEAVGMTGSYQDVFLRNVVTVTIGN